jgi:hypothetical protein
MLLTCGYWLTDVQSGAIPRSPLFDCLDHTNQIWIVKEFLARRDLYLAIHGTYDYVLNVSLKLGQLQASIDCDRCFYRDQFHQRGRWNISMRFRTPPMDPVMCSAWGATSWPAHPTSSLDRIWELFTGAMTC